MESHTGFEHKMTVTTRSGGGIQFGFCVYGKFPAINAYGYYFCNCGGFGISGAYSEDRNGRIGDGIAETYLVGECGCGRNENIKRPVILSWCSS